MKTAYKLVIALCFAITAQVQAQSTFRLGELNPYFSEYLQPMTTGLALGLGQGWVHRAKPHKVLGFDLKLSGAVLEIPMAARNFNGTALEAMRADGYSLQRQGDVVSFDRELPTIASDASASYGLKRTLGTNTPIDVPLLDGLDLPYAGNVALQFALGLSDKVEVMVRYMPEMAERINGYANVDALSVTELNMWGVGMKYNVKEWIPIVKHIPIIHLSAVLAYSEYNMGVVSSQLALNPSALVTGSTVINDPFYNENPNIYDDQGFGINMNSLTGTVVFGAFVPIIHPYIGIGFNRYSADAGLRGNFPVIQVDQEDNVDIIAIEENPLNIANRGMLYNVQLGVNFKIAILNISAQYVIQEYNMLSVGVSVGLR